MDLTNLHYEKEKKIYSKAKKKGYDVKYLSRGVAHFQKGKENIVSIKGTDPLNIKDLQSDLSIANGNTSNDEQFRNRKKEIKNIYKSIPKDGHINLVGHSLGGSIGTSILSKSKSLLNRTDEANFFNTGYTKEFHKELKKDLDKEERQELNEKITHHIIKGDLISTQLKSGSIGKVIQYEAPDDSTLLEKHSLSAFQ